jgi:hypothetical protein
MWFSSWTMRWTAYGQKRLQVGACRDRFFACAALPRMVEQIMNKAQASRRRRVLPPREDNHDGAPMDTSADLPQLAAAGPANLPANLPAVLDDIAPPPLIRDDTAASYEALFAHIIAEVRPRGIVEHIWVRDFVDLAFEVVRLRGLKADLLTAGAGEGLRTVLRDLGIDDYFSLAKRWHARDPDAIATVEAALAAAGLGLGVVRAQALAARLREVEAIDRMIRSAEARRDEMLRQLYRHQAELAERLRRAAAAQEAVQEAVQAQIEVQVQDAALAHVPPQSGQYPDACG